MNLTYMYNSSLGGPGSPGYAACEELTGPQFESVFYKNLWASNFKMMSLYMVRPHAVFVI